MTDHVTCHSPHVTLKDRNAKAELNRRSQVCEILAGTGISRRGKKERGHLMDVVTLDAITVGGHILRAQI